MGYTITLRGYIDTDNLEDYVTLEGLVDGSTATFDAEDGSPTFTAMIEEAEFSRDASEPRLIRYSVRMQEVDNPS
ncbi:MAG: hypothetical protein QW390_04110 [Candidatus Bathyarchaeia archaeon]